MTTGSDCLKTADQKTDLRMQRGVRLPVNDFVAPVEKKECYFTVIVSDRMYVFPLLSHACTTTLFAPAVRVSEVRSELVETVYLDFPSTKTCIEVIGAEPVA